MKLASIEKIIDLQPIDGADVIEKAQVLGWWVIVKKGEYKVGDLCSYIQIDTIVPERPEFEFLRPRNFRVRTIKLKGQISQGLIIPCPKGKWKEGDDVTDILEVQKYSKDIAVQARKPRKWYTKYIWLFKKRINKIFPFLFAAKKSDSFPSHLVQKTDEDRIQNMPSVLERYRGQLFIVSEKLDGSSITLINDKNGLRICSRNFEVTGKSDNEFVNVVQETKFANHINSLVGHYGAQNIIVQGEYIGKPQKNYYKLNGNEIRLFNIFVDAKKIAPVEFYNVCQALSIPVCDKVSETVLDFNMQDIVKLADGKSLVNPKINREGLVFRDVLGTISFKVVSNNYLIKNEE